MRLVFADTLYWGAVLHPKRSFRLVTTDEVLTELLDGLAQRGRHLREAAACAVRKILDDRRVTVHRKRPTKPS